MKGLLGTNQVNHFNLYRRCSSLRTVIVYYHKQLYLSLLHPKEKPSDLKK